MEKKTTTPRLDLRIESHRCYYALWMVNDQSMLPAAHPFTDALVTEIGREIFSKDVEFVKLLKVQQEGKRWPTVLEHIKNKHGTIVKLYRYLFDKKCIIYGLKLRKKLAYFSSMAESFRPVKVVEPSPELHDHQPEVIQVYENQAKNIREFLKKMSQLLKNDGDFVDDENDLEKACQEILSDLENHLTKQRQLITESTQAESKQREFEKQISNMNAELSTMQHLAVHWLHQLGDKHKEEKLYTDLMKNVQDFQDLGTNKGIGASTKILEILQKERDAFEEHVQNLLNDKEEYAKTLQLEMEEKLKQKDAELHNANENSKALKEKSKENEVKLQAVTEEIEELKRASKQTSQSQDKDKYQKQVVELQAKVQEMEEQAKKMQSSRQKHTETISRLLTEKKTMNALLQKIPTGELREIDEKDNASKEIKHVIEHVGNLQGKVDELQNELSIEKKGRTADADTFREMILNEVADRNETYKSEIKKMHEKHNEEVLKREEHARKHEEHVKTLYETHKVDMKNMQDKHEEKTRKHEEQARKYEEQARKHEEQARKHEEHVMTLLDQHNTQEAELRQYKAELEEERLARINDKKELKEHFEEEKGKKDEQIKTLLKPYLYYSLNAIQVVGTNIPAISVGSAPRNHKTAVKFKPASSG